MCQEFNIREKRYDEEPVLNFGLVGVFRNYGLSNIVKDLKESEICGKLVSVLNLLITVPINMLLEIF